MQCTSGGSEKSAGCGVEFLAMRECNRMKGAHLVADAAGGYAFTPSAAGQFDTSGAMLTGSVPPTRSLASM